MTRTEILATATDYVSIDRNATHGEPEDNFATIAKLWEAYLFGRKNRSGLGPHDVAVMNILQKVSRICNSPECADHWIDIAGYAACGGQCATQK